MICFQLLVSWYSEQLISTRTTRKRCDLLSIIVFLGSLEQLGWCVIEVRQLQICLTIGIFGILLKQLCGFYKK